MALEIKINEEPAPCSLCGEVEFEYAYIEGLGNVCSNCMEYAREMGSVWRQ